MSEPDAARREQTLHRLEAFSDIVIAFSLSQLAFTLQIPQSGGHLRVVQIVAFFGSFALVCIFWWLHHQLFARYFVPDIPSVVMNFAFLACTVLVVYSQQLMFHYDTPDVHVVGAYALSFGCAYGLLAVLFVKGLRDPRLTLTADERRTGVQRAVRLAAISFVLLVSVVLAALHFSVETVIKVWLVIPVLGLAQRVFERFTRGRQSSAQTTG